MFIHDVIKIKYIREGYLPNFPYHLITDKEMIDAFWNADGYFQANYPCVNIKLQDEYDELVSAIKYHTDKYLNKESEDIPKWVYSYMLGNVISINTPEEDIDNLIRLLNLEIPDASEFTPDLSEQCYKISKEWVKKMSSGSDKRPATIFGEPHVIKSLRLEEVNVLD